MSEAIETYLNRVMIYAHRSADDAPRVRGELKDHLLARVDDEQRAGVAPEDAVFRAIEAMGSPKVVGYRLRPKLPWVDVRSHGTARGVIAVGPRAVGVIACGGAALGVFSFGGFSMGVFGIGGFTVGLLYAWGGFTLALLGLSFGGFAVGLVAAGGVAVGPVAYGGKCWSWTDGAWLEPYVPVKSILKAARFWSWLTLINLVTFTVAYAAMMRLAWGERRRLRRADPTLAE